MFDNRRLASRVADVRRMLAAAAGEGARSTARLTTAIDSLEGSIQGRRAEIELLKDEIRAKEGQIATIVLEADDARGDARRAAERAQRLDAELGQARQRLTDAEAERSQLGTLLLEARATLAERDEELRVSEERLRVSEAESAAHARRAAESGERADREAARATALEGDNERLRVENEELRRDKERLESENEELGGMVTALVEAAETAVSEMRCDDVDFLRARVDGLASGRSNYCAPPEPQSAPAPADPPAPPAADPHQADASPAEDALCAASPTKAAAATTALDTMIEAAAEATDAATIEPAIEAAVATPAETVPEMVGHPAPVTETTTASIADTAPPASPIPSFASGLRVRSAPDHEAQPFFAASASEPYAPPACDPPPAAEPAVTVDPEPDPAGPWFRPSITIEIGLAGLIDATPVRNAANPAKAAERVVLEFLAARSIAVGDALGQAARRAGLIAAEAWLGLPDAAWTRFADLRSDSPAVHTPAYAETARAVRASVAALCADHLAGRRAAGLRAVVVADGGGVDADAFESFAALLATSLPVAPTALPPTIAVRLHRAAARRGAAVMAETREIIHPADPRRATAGGVLRHPDIESTPEAFPDTDEVLAAASPLSRAH